MENEVRVTVIATDFQEGWQNPRAAAPGGRTPRRPSVPTPDRSGARSPDSSGGFSSQGGFGSPSSNPPKKPSIYDVPGFFKKQ